MNTDEIKIIAEPHRDNDAGGIEAISRWLRSEATTPPVPHTKAVRIPKGCQQVHVSVQKTILVFHPRVFQKLLQLFAKRFNPMMLDLIADVFLHPRTRCRAHRKSTISFLPRKSTQLDLVTHPHRRCFLQFAQKIRQTMRGLQSNKKVHMIGHTADTLRNSTEARHGTTKIRVQRFAPGIGDQRRAVLCGKHDVVMQSEKRRWHGEAGRLASLQDASLRRMSSGGVASLNHRLIAMMPSAS